MSAAERIEDVPWGDTPEPRVQLAAPRKCRRHEWDHGSLRSTTVDGLAVQVVVRGPACIRCGKPKDEATARRGRTNRSRGNAIERFVCSLLGIKRVGQYGGLEDGGSSEDHLVVQVKSGGAHQASLQARIKTIPARSDQLRGWVTVSTPGAGHRREGVISFDLAEFAAWYGKGVPEDIG